MQSVFGIWNLRPTTQNCWPRFKVCETNIKGEMKEVNLIPFKKKRSIKKNKSKFIWLGKDCWSGNMNTHQTHRLHVTPQRVFFGNWTLAFLICSWNEPYWDCKLTEVDLLFLKIYLFDSAGSWLRHVGSSSLAWDRTHAAWSGSLES